MDKTNVILAIMLGLESTQSAYNKGLITRKEYEAGYNQAHYLYCNHWRVFLVNGEYVASQRVPRWNRRIR